MWREIAGYIWSGKDPGTIKNRRNTMKTAVADTMTTGVTVTNGRAMAS
jgi:hypothetical protein